MWIKSAAIFPLIFFGVAFAQPDSQAGLGFERVQPESVGVSSQRLTLLDDMLEQHVQDGRVAGLVAGMLHKGKLVYLESKGWQELEVTPMRPDSLFQIRSMSKPITAVAVLQLVERGLLKLDDPVADFIPSFADVRVFDDPVAQDFGATHDPSRAITIEDLLKNTAGLSHRFSALYRDQGVRSRGDTLAQLVDKVAGVPLIGDPGEQWVYSISLTVLGRVVEVVSGQDFDDYLEQEVFKPLAMNDTSFFVPPEKQDQLALIYSVTDHGLELLPDMSVPITQDPPLKEGAAGIVSSVPDYLNFLQMLLDQGRVGGGSAMRVLQDDTVAEMTKNQVDERLMPFGTNPARPMLDRGWGYGLAVVVDAEKSEYATHIGEFGWSGSLGTFAWADPVSDTALVLMLQIQPAGAYSLSQKFKALAAQAILEY